MTGLYFLIFNRELGVKVDGPSEKPRRIDRVKSIPFLYTVYFIRITTSARYIEMENIYILTHHC